MTADDRVTALELAVEALASGGNLTVAQAGDVTAVADVFYRWLTGPVTITLTVNPITYWQASPERPGMQTIEDGRIVQLTDLQQVTLSVAEQDSKGQPVTGDNLTWAVDNPGVIAITPDSTGYTCMCVAGTDGTATVTVTDNTVTPPLTATDVITVVSSAATSLVINEGTPENQPPVPTPGG